MQIETLAQRLVAENTRLVTVESCTGGLVAAKCTALAGSSVWFDGGWVTYSIEHKVALGVDSDLIKLHGVVSEPVAIAMVNAGLASSTADYALAVTGIAGPGGAEVDQPVGTVCFAWAGRREVCSATAYFNGDRQQVREQSCDYVLQALLDWLNSDSKKTN